MDSRNTGYAGAFPAQAPDALFDESAFYEDDAGVFLPNAEGRTEFLPPDAEHIPVIEHAVKHDSPIYAARPAQERTRELIAQMKQHKAPLLSIIENARRPISTARIEQILEARSAREFSLYAPSTLCVMLETAGAIERVDEEGRPYDARSRRPDIVTIDGEDYWKPAQAPAVCWKATEAGLSVAAEDAPEARIERLFEREADMLCIHKRVLAMAGASQGASVTALSASLDAHPLIANPRRFFVQHFIEGLERAGAIEWRDNAWKATEAGRAALDDLADVADDYKAPAAEQPKRPAAETDGIRW